jgi:hypothetical protein
VITYAFTGIVTSMITTPKYQFVVRSIEEVANNEEIMPLIIEESSTHVAFEVKMFKIFYDNNKSEINVLII